MGVQREEFFKSLAIVRVDRQQWAEAYDSEYQGFYEHQTLKVARPEPGT